MTTPDKSTTAFVTLAFHEKEIADRDREIALLQAELAAANEAVTIRQAALEQRTAENELLQARLDAALAALNEADRFLSHPLDPDDVVCAHDVILDAIKEAANAE